MKAPKVSVCMITYNQARTIEQAMESVLAQETPFAFELVVGEDCSTDGTRDRVRALAARRPDIVRPLVDGQNLGAQQNFLRTFAVCRGDYVVILEGDDYFVSPHKLARQAQALDDRPDWAMCFHPARCVYEDGLRGPELCPESWDKGEATIVDLFGRNFMATSAVMFRNRLLPQFPRWFGKTLLGDWPLHILHAAHGNIGFLPEAMSAYRIHPGGLWSRMDLASQLNLTLQMYDHVDDHFVGKYAEEIDAQRMNILNWLVGQASSSSEVKELQRAYDQLTHDFFMLQARAVVYRRPLKLKVRREATRLSRQVRGVVRYFARRSHPPSAHTGPQAA